MTTQLDYINAQIAQMQGQISQIDINSDGQKAQLNSQLTQVDLSSAVQKAQLGLQLTSLQDQSAKLNLAQPSE